MTPASTVPIAPARQVVDDMLATVEGCALTMDYAQRLDMVRQYILTSVSRRTPWLDGADLRYYAAQLDDVDQRITAWSAAGDAAELCDDADHWERFPDSDCGVHAIDDHVRAHLPRNAPES